MIELQLTDEQSDLRELTPLAIAGSEALEHRHLTRLTEAPRFASFCLTEPGAGIDAASLRT